MAMSTPAAPAPTSPAVEKVKHPTEILFVLLLAALSFALSQTMIVPAIPTLTKDLHASTSSASWLLTGYLLSASVATPIVGKLGDLYGKGRVLTIVLLTFAVGSVICAVGNSIEVLIAGRVIQGVAGGVFPLAFGIIRDTFPREKVAGGIGLMSAVFGIGGGVGLPLSGLIIDNADISIIFWLGLIAVPAALAAHHLIPESPRVERVRIDWLGAFLLSLALVALLLGVTEANDWGWTSGRTLGLIIGGLALLAFWIRMESRHPEPLVDMRVMRGRAVATTNLAGLFIGFAMFASFLLIPQFAQAPESTGYGFGMSVTESGLLLVPSSLVMLIAGPLAGVVGSRWGFRVSLMFGTLCTSAAFAILAIEHSHPWHFILSGVFMGVGLSFGFASMANLIVAAVPQTDVGIATGINTITRTIGGAFGSAVAVAILSSETIGNTPIAEQRAYVTAFIMSAGVALLAFAAAVLVPRLERPARATAPAEPATSPEAAPAQG
jgi:EmrB/QacA subfamily drug resistance transporter